MVKVMLSQSLDSGETSMKVKLGDLRKCHGPMGRSTEDRLNRILIFAPLAIVVLGRVNVIHGGTGVLKLIASGVDLDTIVDVFRGRRYE